MVQHHHSCRYPTECVRNPVWYTTYTPYPDRSLTKEDNLEATMNFQTAVCDLTGVPLANCSLLDEATAAAEAMPMMYALRPRDMQKAGANMVFVDEAVFHTDTGSNGYPCYPRKVSSYGPWENIHELEFTSDIFACVLQ